MKLSEIKGEEALDVLADIIDPITRIMSDKEVARIFETGQSKLKLVKFILKKHKKDAIEIMARLECEEPDEYVNKITVTTLPVKILEILNDKELMAVFSTQSQTSESTSFGSATENTEEKEQ